ncbi:hypothetical protein RDI58_003652 [Solanum bulbocastanum]|uniref:Uncharacterized protein n=1 Tax=Solanum bulbocastanum TaxID=147425 RepID=A0AAN8U653_SOLBU
MDLQSPIYKSDIPNQIPKMNLNFSSTRLQNCQVTPLNRICKHRKQIITACLKQKIPVKLENLNPDSCISDEQQVKAVAVGEEIPVVNSNGKEEFSGKESIWDQMVEIVKFSGPAVGPGTVFCDNTSYVFMFLSIATSNLVATSLAKQDKDEVQG